MTDCLAVIDGLAPLLGRIDGELRQQAKADPRVKVLQALRTRMVSQACITSGAPDVPRVSIALKAAGSWKFGFWPVVVSFQTGEQTV